MAEQIVFGILEVGSVEICAEERIGEGKMLFLSPAKVAAVSLLPPTPFQSVCLFKYLQAGMIATVCLVLGDKVSLEDEHIYLLPVVAKPHMQPEQIVLSLILTVLGSRLHCAGLSVQ